MGEDRWSLDSVGRHAGEKAGTRRERKNCSGSCPSEEIPGRRYIWSDPGKNSTVSSVYLGRSLSLKFTRFDKIYLGQTRKLANKICSILLFGQIYLYNNPKVGLEFKLLVLLWILGYNIATCRDLVPCPTALSSPLPTLGSFPHNRGFMYMQVALISKIHQKTSTEK